MYLNIYYAYMYTIVMAAGPVILLIAINSAIVIYMRRFESLKNKANNVLQNEREPR